MTQYNFEWDPKKAKINIRKHGVSFEEATTVFRDPNAITIFDEDHTGKEERWITIGLSVSGRLIMFVIHILNYQKIQLYYGCILLGKLLQREKNNIEVLNEKRI